MTVFNRLLNKRPVRGIAAVLGMEDQEGVGTLAPELFPVFDCWRDPENRQPLGDRLRQGVQQIAAGGAGNRSEAALTNPPNSNVLLVLEAYELVNATAAARDFDVGVVEGEPFASTGNLVVRDTRIGTTSGGGGGSGRLRQKNNSAASALGSVVAQHHVPANDTKLYAIAYVLSPGFSLVFRPSADDSTLWVNVWTRERPMENKERERF